LTKTSFQTILNFDNKNKVFLTKKHFLNLHKREFLISHDLTEFQIIANELLRNLYHIKKQLLAVDLHKNDLAKIVILLEQQYVKTMIEYIDLLKLNVLNLFDFFLQDKEDEKLKLVQILNELEEDEEYCKYIWGEENDC